MKRIAAIPARSGSRGLENKNVIPLCGKPLMAYTINAAVQFGLFELVIVTTDSKEYAKTAEQYGASVIIREPYLSSDTATTYMVLEDFFRNFSMEIDYFALLQPTSPFRISNHILVNAIDSDCTLKNFIGDYANYRRQIYDECIPNGAIYLAKKEAYLNQKHFYGKNSLAYFMNEEDVTISIIVPVFNVEKYIANCIDSLLKQTYKNLEIILVDDCSDDKSRDICQIYASREERIRLYLHKKNQGLAAARNTGLLKMTGQYIMFVDSDDHIHRRACKILYSEMVKTGSQIGIGDFLCIDNKSIIDPDIKINSIRQFTGSSKFFKLFDTRDRVRTIVAWGKLYHSDIFRHIRFPEGKLYEDEYVCHYTLGEAEKVVYVDLPLYYYYQRSDSITREKFSIKNTDIVPALIDRINFFSERNMEYFTYMAAGDCLKRLPYYYVQLFHLGLHAEREKIFCLFRKIFYTYHKKMSFVLKVKCRIFLIIPWFYSYSILIRKIFVWKKLNK